MMIALLVLTMQQPESPPCEGKRKGRERGSRDGRNERGKQKKKSAEGRRHKCADKKNQCAKRRPPWRKRARGTTDLAAVGGALERPHKHVLCAADDNAALLELAAVGNAGHQLLHLSGGDLRWWEIQGRCGHETGRAEKKEKKNRDNNKGSDGARCSGGVAIETREAPCRGAHAGAGPAAEVAAGAGKDKTGHTRWGEARLHSCALFSSGRSFPSPHLPPTGKRRKTRRRPSPLRQAAPATAARGAAALRRRPACAAAGAQEADTQGEEERGSPEAPPSVFLVFSPPSLGARAACACEQGPRRGRGRDGGRARALAVALRAGKASAGAKKHREAQRRKKKVSNLVYSSAVKQKKKKKKKSRSFPSLSFEQRPRHTPPDAVAAAAALTACAAPGARLAAGAGGLGFFSPPCPCPLNVHRRGPFAPRRCRRCCCRCRPCGRIRSPGGSRRRTAATTWCLEEGRGEEREKAATAEGENKARR